MSISLIVSCVIITEALTEYADMVVKDRKLDWHVIVTALIGIGAALLFGVDVFELIGITAKVPYVGMVLTGILISRGGNYIHDVLKRLGVKPSAPDDTLGDDPSAVHEAHEVEG